MTPSPLPPTWGAPCTCCNQNGVFATRPVDQNEPTVLGEVLNTQYYTDVPETEEGQIRMDRLFVWNGRVYGMCTPTGEVWTLLDDTGAFAPAKVEGLTVDTSGLIRKEEGEEYSSTVGAEQLLLRGRLAVLHRHGVHGHAIRRGRPHEPGNR